MSIRVKHYNASNGRPRVKRDPDAELDAYLYAREGHPSTESEAALRKGIPAANGTEVRHSPRWKQTREKRDYRTVRDASGNPVQVNKRDHKWVKVDDGIGCGKVWVKVEVQRKTRAPKSATAPASRATQDRALQMRMSSNHENDV